jgi:hypothetical protein
MTGPNGGRVGGAALESTAEKGRCDKGRFRARSGGSRVKKKYFGKKMILSMDTNLYWTLSAALDNIH